MGDDLSPADIFYSNFSGPEVAFITFAFASAMGLLPTDNVDGLDIGPTLEIEDCNCNDIDVACDISRGFSNNCNGNDLPDECERADNDCNCNDVPDECDLAEGTSLNCNANDIPDECEPDCDGDLILDECEIADCLPDDPACQDCNGNDIPNECDIAQGTSPDTNADGVPDECGACCGLTGVCSQAVETACEAPAVYQGDGTNCDDVVCAAIPTVSEWGLVVMTLLVLVAGTLVLRHRRAALE